MHIEQDDYIVCGSTDEQTWNQYVEYKEAEVITNLITCEGKKDRFLSYKIIGLAATLALASGNGTYHLKNQSVVIFLLIETKFVIIKRQN